MIHKTDMTKGKWIRQILIVGISVPLLMLLGGYIIWLLEASLVNPWIIITCAAAVALISGIALSRMWQKLLSFNNIYLCFAINAVVMTGIVTALILSLNYFTAAAKTHHIEKGTVERVFTKTRHTSRRVSRRVYVQGQPYKVYFIEIKLYDDEHDASQPLVKEIEVKYATYRKTRKNDTIEIETSKGILGIPVLFTSTLKNTTPHPRRKIDPHSLLRH